MPATVLCAARHAGAAAILLAAFLIFAAGPAGDRSPDVRVDFDRPAAGIAQTVDFELGSNELYDLFADGGVERSRRLGSQRIRIWLGHRFLGRAVRSTQPFDFDWELLYSFVSRVLDAGAVPQLSFVAAPAWVTALNGQPSSQHESEAFDASGARAYAEYVVETIQRLHNRFGVRVLDWPYVVWNEPNNFQNAGARYACGDGSAYLELYRQVRQLTDQRFGAGRIQLGGPSLDGIDTGPALDAAGLPRCGATPDLDWETYLRGLDAEARFDFITWHWYGMFAIGETAPQDVLLTRLNWFEDRVRRVSEIAAGRPHYVEEINLNGDLAADPLLDQQINAAFLSSALLRAVRQGANGFLVYKGTRQANGLSPRGEPDFGLWTSDLAAPATPAFHALRLLRRVLGQGDKLAWVEMGVPDIDALALNGSAGRVLAIVNLNDGPRDVTIEGLAAGAYVYSDATAAWASGWFDGRTLSLRAHAVAVITSESWGLPALPAVMRGRDAFQSGAGGLACAVCHGLAAEGGTAAALRGLGRPALEAAHAVALTSGTQRSDLAAYLRGLVDVPHEYQGVVRDPAGVPVVGAIVLAESGAAARVAVTDDDGRFSLSAPRGEAGVDSAPARFTVIHPDYRAGRPAGVTGITPSLTELQFELKPLSDEQRPLVAAPYVVPSGTPGVWEVGLATAGDGLRVWAIDRLAGFALRLRPVPDHPYGLQQDFYGVKGPAPGDRDWRMLAIGPDGVPSRIADLPATPQPAG